jgi:diadenosine tetraphosphate (Ap4A) HIT family hydrolase
MIVSTKAKTLKTGNDVLFGNDLLNSGVTFILRKNVMAFVAGRALTKGHVIVSPRRVLKRLTELNEIETLELWCCSQEVVKVLENIYKTDCILIVQDGTDAGQPVDHAHINIIPNQPALKLALDERTRLLHHSLTFP